jgi:hypothetical protein
MLEVVATITLRVAAVVALTALVQMALLQSEVMAGPEPQIALQAHHFFMLPVVVAALKLEPLEREGRALGGMDRLELI